MAPVQANMAVRRSARKIVPTAKLREMAEPKVNGVVKTNGIAKPKAKAAAKPKPSTICFLYSSRTILLTFYATVAVAKTKTAAPGRRDHHHLRDDHADMDY